ncbi:MAG TPA: hypothetical protein VJH34_02020 [archaeon]|nr:hypothetical protein [archaeon]
MKLKPGRIFNLIGIVYGIVYVFLYIAIYIIFFGSLAAYTFIIPLMLGVIGFVKGDKRLGVISMALGIIIILLLIMSGFFLPRVEAL